MSWTIRSHLFSIHVTSYRTNGLTVSTGFPVCWASQTYTIWPLVYTSLQAYVNICMLQGLPFVSGFPISHNQVSDVDRLPCIYRSHEGPPDQSGFPDTVDMASLFVGLPHIAGWSCPTATVGKGPLCTQNKMVVMVCQPGVCTCLPVGISQHKDPIRM